MTLSGRPLAVAGLATGLAATLGAVLLPATVPAEAGFQALLVAGCAAAGSLATGWLWLLALLVVHDVLRGRTVRDGVPRAVRRVVIAACGLGLAGGLAAPAYAGEQGPPPRRTAPALAGLPLPDRTTTTTRWLGTPADHRTAPGTDAPGTVRVSPGDSLWSLAEQSLPPGATPAQVERCWRDIYVANRGLVGPDPDLIRPGQRLQLPATDDTARRS